MVIEVVNYVIIYYVDNIYIIIYVSKLREIHPPLQQKGQRPLRLCLLPCFHLEVLRVLGKFGQGVPVLRFA